MSDIVKKDVFNQNQGIQLNKGKLRSTSTPFQQRVNQAKSEALDANTMPNRICLMLDRSSSMTASERDKNGVSKSRIELLKEAVQSFVARCNLNDTAIACETFSPSIELALTNNPAQLDNFTFGLYASGSTPMHTCVELCLSKVPMTRGVLVSDGGASDWGYHSINDEEYVENTSDKILHKYQEAGIPIDCVHISNSSDGEELLKRIAKVTGGLFIKFTDVSAFATAFGYLAPGMRGMLTNGRVSASDIGAREIE